MCLKTPFRCHYTALYQAVGEYHPQSGELAHLAAEHLPAPKKRAFWPIDVDVTSQPRECASTLDNRTFVYKPKEKRLPTL